MNIDVLYGPLIGGIVVCLLGYAAAHLARRGRRR